MLLVVCVDLDDDIGRKTDVETPVVGRDAVEDAAVALATADPEDSDVNVLFQGVHLADTITDQSVEVAAVTGNERGDVRANRAVGDEVDEVLASLATSEEVTALIVTDGAQDESVIPVIRSRVTVDGVRRVVVRQAQDLESMYYTLKQVMNDPETRGTILVPLGILLMIYPLAILADLLELPGEILGLSSAALGLYVLGRGLGVGDKLDRTVERARTSLYAGRVTLLSYVVAAALLGVGAVTGMETLDRAREMADGDLTAVQVLGALVYGSIRWFTAAGVTTSLGQITDEYIAGRLELRYLNAPFYVVAMGTVLYGVSAYFLELVSLSFLAATLTGGTLLGVASTLAFAVAETHYGADDDGDRVEPTN
jgi:putative membrane protein